jgi:hypothetical protein
MASCEQLAQELVRILLRLSHDPLLHEADVTGDLGDHLSFPPGDRGDDRVRETKRGGRVQPAALHPGRHRLGLLQRRLQRNLGALRTMHGDQEVLPNELVELEIMHVAACADLRCVHDDEHVVRIHMDSGNVVTVSAFTDRDRMKLELLRQDRLGGVAPHWNIEP